MTAEDSLNQSMEKAVRHYSSLFQLPSYRRVFSLLALACVGGGMLSVVILFPSVGGVASGLLFGFSLFLANILADSMISKLILQDTVYGLRRTLALSLYCWVVWLSFILVGAVVGVYLGVVWWAKLSLLGFSAVLTLRLIVLSATSSASPERSAVASLLQPFFCVAPFIAFWTQPQIAYAANSSLLLFLAFAAAVGLFSSFGFLFLLNRLGKQMLGFPSMDIFKAFLLNWAVGSNEPFEEFLEKLGEERNVEVSLIKFSSHKPKAAVIVPAVHPGPFKNVGSSLLPSMLKASTEKKLDCDVAVPHGLLGHEFDLASQAQNQKIIDRVLETINFETSETKATPFIRVSNGLATASCQVFGKIALLSFTLAPRTTEDFPHEFGLFVRAAAEKHGFKNCVVVNAHNSIDGTINMQNAFDELKTVGADCLEKAASLESLPFEVGAATVKPNEFGLKDGMGPGGITVLLVNVGGQKAAYVVIDGNNMVSGLREKLLSALHSVGVDEGEVLTTDTHSVNAVIMNRRGYHPIGEAMDHDKLINHVKEAVLAATSRLEPAKAAYDSVTVSNAKVIGAKQLETLCQLIDRTIQRAKKIVFPIFVFSGLLLTLFLAFL